MLWPALALNTIGLFVVGEIVVLKAPLVHISTSANGIKGGMLRSSLSMPVVGP